MKLVTLVAFTSVFLSAVLFGQVQPGPQEVRDATAKELLRFVVGDDERFCLFACARVLADSELEYEKEDIKKAIADGFSSDSLNSIYRGARMIEALCLLARAYDVTDSYDVIKKLAVKKGMEYDNLVRLHETLAALAQTVEREFELTERFAKNGQAILDELDRLGATEYRKKRKETAEAVMHGILLSRHDTDIRNLGDEIDSFIEREDQSLPYPWCPLAGVLQSIRVAEEMEEVCGQESSSLRTKLISIMRYQSFIYRYEGGSVNRHRKSGILPQRGGALLDDLYNENPTAFEEELFGLYKSQTEVPNAVLADMQARFPESDGRRRYKKEP